MACASPIRARRRPSVGTTTVAGALMLENGVLFTSDIAMLEVLHNATSTPGSASSHVDGPMRKASGTMTSCSPPVPTVPGAASPCRDQRPGHRSSPRATWMALHQHHGPGAVIGLGERPGTLDPGTP